MPPPLPGSVPLSQVLCCGAPRAHRRLSLARPGTHSLSSRLSSQPELVWPLPAYYTYTPAPISPPHRRECPAERRKAAPPPRPHPLPTETGNSGVSSTTQPTAAPGRGGGHGTGTWVQGDLTLRCTLTGAIPTTTPNDAPSTGRGPECGWTRDAPQPMPVFREHVIRLQAQLPSACPPYLLGDTPQA